jgi:glutaredoxin 3
MKSVTVYTTQACPHCARAKDLLRRKKIPFQEIDVSQHPEKRKEAEERYGWMTVPIIVIGEKCIGGAQELYELEKRGELESL